MEEQIEFERVIDKKIEIPNNDELDIGMIGKTNFEIHKKTISNSIDLFNSEVTWDGMWDLEESKNRLNKDHILFLLFRDSKVLGHLWFDTNIIYNVFVSNKRVDGDSVYFVENCLHIICKKYNYDKIKLVVDKWNERAINFWKKLQFKEKHSISQKIKEK